MTKKIESFRRLRRLPVSEEKQRELVQAYHESGESRPAFVRRHTINYKTFSNWVTKYRNITKAAESTPAKIKPAGSGFAQLVIPQQDINSPDSWDLELESGGVVVRAKARIGIEKIAHLMHALHEKGVCHVNG